MHGVAVAVGSGSDRQIAGHGLVEYGVCFVWLVGVMPLQSTRSRYLS